MGEYCAKLAFACHLLPRYLGFSISDDATRVERIHRSSVPSQYMPPNDLAFLPRRKTVCKFSCNVYYTDHRFEDGAAGPMTGCHTDAHNLACLRAGTGIFHCLGSKPPTTPETVSTTPVTSPTREISESASASFPAPELLAAELPAPQFRTSTSGSARCCNLNNNTYCMSLRSSCQWCYHHHWQSGTGA